MRKEPSQWSKDVRKAMIDEGMTIKQLAENVGYSFAVISSVINGRYSNKTYRQIVEKINERLGTKGLPERVNTPSRDWCNAVKAELLYQDMSINQLAEKMDVSRDRISLVINGKMMNEDIVNTINRILDIKLSAIPADDN